MQKSYCIICGREKDGIEIEEDLQIAIIKWFKTHITKNVKNNRLVVCKECYPKYKEAYKRYKRREYLYIILWVLFFSFSLFLYPSLYSIMASLILGLLFLIIIILIEVPALKLNKKR